MITFKKRFHEKYKKCTTKAYKYSLEKIKHQSPVVYSADKVMQDWSKIRCDSFVLCCCAPSTTGIYVVEEEKKVGIYRLIRLAVNYKVEQILYVVS